MLHALGDMMPTSTWTNPQGGFYVWVKVPDGLDTKAMLPRAVTARVAYVPGTAFYADSQGRDHMRLSYCYPSPERIREGVRRLAGVIDEELDVQTTFGPSPRTVVPGSSVESPGPDLS